MEVLDLDRKAWAATMMLTRERYIPIDPSDGYSTETHPKVDNVD